MKNIKNRTKLYKAFKRVPIKITDEIAVIMINGKLIDIGRKCTILNREVRVAFASNKQADFFKSNQERFKCLPQYWGRIKDDIFFVWGWHRGDFRGSGRNIIRKYRQNDARLAGEMMKDNCFTGYHRSGDQRNITAAIKIEPKTKF